MLFLKVHCHLLLVSIVAVSSGDGVASAQSQRPPNIVFVLADDLGYRELGSFGQQKIKTPNLDRLAKQGVKLTNHYCGNAVCAPSRCVLMTGKHPGHAFVRDNRSTPPEGQFPIPDATVTLAETLKQLGYVTGGFGKWGLGGPESSGEPLRQGFDHFTGYLCQGVAHSYYPASLWQNGKPFPLNNDPPIPGHASLDPDADPGDLNSYRKFKGQDYAPDRIHTAAIQFIRDNKEEPFFLYYPSIIPHVALHVPDEDLEPYLQLGWKDPPFTRAKSGYTPHFTPRAAYAAMITRLDRYVGNVLNELDTLGLAENTIVVFTSDNGTTHLKDEVDYEFFDSVGELRGLKGSLYEGGIRVPTLVRWPGHVNADSTCDFVSGFEDWLPTLLEAVGNTDAHPDAVDGISIVPAICGKPQNPRPYLYREFMGYGGQQSIRVGHWKAIRQNLRRNKLDVELYNLADDIGEQNNVAADHPEVVEKLTGMMRSARTRSKEFPLKALD